MSIAEGSAGLILQQGLQLARWRPCSAWVHSERYAGQRALHMGCKEGELLPRCKLPAPLGGWAGGMCYPSHHGHLLY